MPHLPVHQTLANKDIQLEVEPFDMIATVKDWLQVCGYIMFVLVGGSGGVGKWGVAKALLRL